MEPDLNEICCVGTYCERKLLPNKKIEILDCLVLFHLFQFLPKCDKSVSSPT